MTADTPLTESEKKTAGCLLAFLLVPLSWLIIAIAARDAWNGIVGPFFTLPALTLAQTFALRIGISVFRRVPVPDRTDRDKPDPWWSVRPLAAAILAYGWVQLALYVWGAA